MRLSVLITAVLVATSNLHAQFRFPDLGDIAIDPGGVLELPPDPAPFRRGDVRADGSVELSDAITLLRHLFFGDPASLSCQDAADANDDGALGISDSVTILAFLFGGARLLPEPFVDCGADRTADGLGCDAFGGCNAEVLPSEQFGKQVLDLVSGRATKVPASWFLRASVSSSSGLKVRARCAGQDDVGMIVQRETSLGPAFFSDDDPQAGGNGLGSYLELGRSSKVQGFTDKFTVVVFSMRRATSFAIVEVDRGSGWEQIAATHIGGTVAKVGPLRQGDFVEVQAINSSHVVKSESGGSLGELADNDTHMVLFDLDGRGKRAAYNDNVNPSNWNPRIQVTDGSWQSRGNIVVLGKVRRMGEPGPIYPRLPALDSSANGGIEARVDLVRGPLDEGPREANFPSTGGRGSTMRLEPGRYYAWIYAATDNPVGHLGPAHSSAEMPCDECPRDSGDAAYFRGTMNDVAFKLHAERNGVATAARRQVFRASLGTQPGLGWNMVLLELKVDSPADYTLMTTAWQSDVHFFEKWRVVRNPDASEISMVTYNTLYDDDHQTEKFLNASNLLATRGSMFPRTGQIEERPDQGPWQWEADIIGLQEVKKVAMDSIVLPPGQAYPNWFLFGLAETFVKEARFRGPRGWGYVKGRDEAFEFGSSGLGPLFLGENIWPGADAQGIFFGSAAKEAAGCEGDETDYAECQLEGYGGITKATNFAVPAKAAALRYGTAPDRPISVFNLHMEYRSEDSDTREKETRSLISTIDRLLEKDPGAFHHDVSHPDARHPQFFRNRAVILGDWNVLAHRCGEHYWLLRQLREHYGYAVDAAQAVNVPEGQNHYGMHDRLGVLGSNGMPAPFQDVGNCSETVDWQASPNFTASSIYPWWAASYRGKSDTRTTKGDRHDMIILVGRGWAYDDPIRDYRLMSDRDDPSPMNPQGGGVEMWQEGAGSVSDSGNNYAPNHSLGKGTGPGKPALHSDHTPVGAWLRVFQR